MLNSPKVRLAPTENLQTKSPKHVQNGPTHMTDPNPTRLSKRSQLLPRIPVMPCYGRLIDLQFLLMRLLLLFDVTAAPCAATVGCSATALDRHGHRGLWPSQGLGQTGALLPFLLTVPPSLPSLPPSSLIVSTSLDSSAAMLVAQFGLGQREIEIEGGMKTQGKFI